MPEVPETFLSQTSTTLKQFDTAPLEQTGQAIQGVQLLSQRHQQGSGELAHPGQHGLETDLSSQVDHPHCPPGKSYDGDQKQQVQEHPECPRSSAFLIIRKQILDAPPERRNRL